MKRTIMMAALAGLFAIGTHTAQAQTTTKHHRAHRVTHTSTARTDAAIDATNRIASDGTVNTQSVTDPLYLNHPYFNGEPRWSHEDSLYKHGDFPWALVNKPGSGYTFNTETGRWEQSSSMGTVAPSR